VATRARLAERQVIRRELHDGLGPWLSGLRLGLQGARNLLELDPAATAAVLDALGAEADARVDDVRALSRSLLPPVLDELGLAAALEELVARHAATGFSVELRCPPLVGLDPAVAAAAYAIAGEAVLNALRHSGADGCRLEVRVDETPDTSAPLGDALVLTCTDDGIGVAADAAGGVGTQSMRERAEELGGSLERGPATSGRGTRVRAVLPLRATTTGPVAAPATPRTAR
jgi:signal transduction histidine kinase